MKNEVLIGKTFKYLGVPPKYWGDYVVKVVGFDDDNVFVKELISGSRFMINKERIKSKLSYYEVEQDKTMVEGLDEFAKQRLALKKAIKRLYAVLEALSELVLTLPGQSRFEKTLTDKIERWDIIAKDLERSWRSRFNNSYKEIIHNHNPLRCYCSIEKAIIK